MASSSVMATLGSVFAPQIAQLVIFQASSFCCDCMTYMLTYFHAFGVFM